MCKAEEQVGRLGLPDNEEEENQPKYFELGAVLRAMNSDFEHMPTY